MPIDTPTLCSLAGNQLCGLNLYGNGTYTAEGITMLCEALKGSAVTSLECAAAPVSAFLSMPLDTRLLALYPTPTPLQLGWQPTLWP